MKGLAYTIALAVFVVDQISKYWVVSILHLPERGSIDITSFFRLTFVGNVGVSMSLLQGGTETSRWLLVAMTGAIALAVAYWITRERNRFDLVALGLILGGAMGNILDRVRLGYVVDFLHFHWHEHSFWVFNGADSAISIGVAMLLGRGLLGSKGNK